MNLQVFKRRIQQGRDALRWRGPARCSALALRQVLRPVLDWYVFQVMEKRVTDEDAVHGCEEPYRVRVFDLADTVETVETALQPFHKHQPADVALRLNTGDAVVIAYVGEKPVGCSWLTFRNRLGMPLDTAWVVRTGEAVSYGTFVLPEWRGRKIQFLLDRAANAYLYNRGVQLNLCSMSAFNPQSLSLAKNSGRHSAMTLVLVRVKGVNWTFRHAFGAPLESRFRRRPSAQQLPVQDAAPERSLVP